jgi:hypothetical protein
MGNGLKIQHNYDGMLINLEQEYQNKTYNTKSSYNRGLPTRLSDPEGYLAAVSHKTVRKSQPIIRAIAIQFNIKTSSIILRPLYSTRLGVGVSSVATRSHKGQRLHDGQAGEDGPDEVTEGDSSLGALAENTSVTVRDANVGGQGGSAGEPEERSESEDAESNHAMVHARSEDGRESEVEQHDDGPHDTEEQKCILRRRAAAPPAGVGCIYD